MECNEDMWHLAHVECRRTNLRKLRYRQLPYDTIHNVGLAYSGQIFKVNNLTWYQGQMFEQIQNSNSSISSSHHMDSVTF